MLDDPLVALVTSVLDPPPVVALAEDTALGDVGLDSLALVDLVLSLQTAYGIQIEPDDICQENFGSIAALRDYLRRRAGLPVEEVHHDGV